VTAKKSVAEVVIGKLKKRDSYLPSKDWNYAHAVGGSCARELAYWRIEPESALPTDPGLALIFAHGKWLEKEGLFQLEQAGYEVSEQDAAFEWKAMQLRGRVDCKIRVDKAKRPVEIKGYEPRSWAKLNTITDFLESPREYLRRVPGQLLSYILMDGKSDRAMLYLINKLTGEPKSIELRLEGETLEWGEALLKKLEVVNKAVASKSLPERIPYEETVCGRCPFRAKCLTDIPAIGEGPANLDPEREAELLDLLKEWDEVRGPHKRYEKVDEAIKTLVKGIPKIILDKFIVTGQEVEQTRVNAKRMPPKTKARWSDTTKYWKKNITVVEEQPPEESADE